MRVGGFVKDLKHVAKLNESYMPAPVELGKLKWQGDKVFKNSNFKIIQPPISMQKLIDLLDKDEYHYACVDAICESCFVEFKCKDVRVQNFIDKIQLPKNEDIISIFSDFIHYYIACGNGFLLKMRNSLGEWVGLNRLIPSEVQIIENFDEFNFLKPNYLQVKSGKKTFFEGKDIIHLLQKNSMSNAWGVACKPIIINIEILSEIKNYDFNRFKNGLLIDFMIFVEGGELREYTDENGNKIDPFEEIEKLFKQAKGNNNSHSTIIIEIPDTNAKVKIEPLRQDQTDFKSLKEDNREGIIAYHRVPRRLIGLQTPGQLGGDDESDMNVFYNMTVKPLQERVAFLLSQEFKSEFNWDVKASDFEFGDITQVLESFTNRIRI